MYKMKIKISLIASVVVMITLGIIQSMIQFEKNSLFSIIGLIILFTPICIFLYFYNKEYKTTKIKAIIAKIVLFYIVIVVVLAVIIFIKLYIER